MINEQKDRKPNPYYELAHKVFDDHRYDDAFLSNPNCQPLRYAIENEFLTEVNAKCIEHGISRKDIDKIIALFKSGIYRI